MNERWIIMLIIGGIGTALTFARRYHNDDEDAGLFVAAATMIVLVMLAMSSPIW